MAASGLPILSNFRPAAILADGGDGPFGRGRRSLLRGDGNVGGGWWAPLPGTSSEAGYAVDEGPAVGEEKAEAPARRKRRRRVFAAFTEEKARELRRTTTATQGFHDAMYHSAIASRLASHLPSAS